MGMRAYDVVVMLSLINQDIHRKAFELAIRDTGDPPGACCLFLTGSHGRLENLLDEEYETVWGYGTPGIGGYLGLKFSI